MSRQDRFSWFAAQHPRQSRRQFLSLAPSRCFGLNRRLHLESLEDRRMLAVITVDSLLDNFDPITPPPDDGAITLREAIVAANTDAVAGDAPAGSGADTILFDGSLNGQKIDLSLTLGELDISDDVTIDASALTLGLTIDANDPTPGSNTGTGIRVFHVDDLDGGNLIDVELIALSLTGGDVTGGGGAIRSLENLTVTGSTISGNAATTFGGGIHAYGPLSIDQSTLSGNSAGASGGAIDAFGSTLFITQSTISDNSAGSTGGGIKTDGTAMITDSTISGNAAGDRGGGMFSNTNLLGTETTTITGSTLSGNTADINGGGLFNFDGRTVIQHSTITDNTSSTGYGGGVASFGDTLTRTEVTSSIISGNASSDVDVVAYYNSNSFVSYGYNLIGTSSSAPSGLVNFNQPGDQINETNPLLGLLTNNGGPTLTHALLATSPAIDAGNPAFAGPPNEDQRGAPFARVVNGTIDIGALETHPTDLVVTTADDELDPLYDAELGHSLTTVPPRSL